MSKRWLGLLVLVLFTTKNAFADIATTGFATPRTLMGDTGATSGNVTDADPVPIDIVPDQTDPDCGLFSITSNATNRTPPFGVNIAFTPLQRGSRTCTFLAFLTGSSTSRGQFDVTGTGIGPHLQPPAIVTIGDVRVIGATTGTANLILRNDGEADGGNLVINSVTPNPGCDFTAGALPSPIAPGTAANVLISFDPAMPGTQTCALTIDTNGTPAANQSVDATGRGTSAIIGVGNASFGATNIVPVGTTAATTMTVSNTASSNAGVLTITSASISPSAGSWITFGAGAGCAGGSTSCTFSSLATSTSTTVPLNCSPPSNATGMQTATVTFSSDTDPGGDTTGSVTCIAGRAEAVPTPVMVMFPDRVVGSTSPTTSVVITNLGNVALNYSLAETDAMNQFTTTMPCSSGCVLAPMASSAPITVAFAPTSVGMKSGNIRITSNDPDGPIDIPLTGTGIAPHLTASLPSPQAFGTIEVGASGTARTLTITNDGTSLLTIASAGLTTANANWQIGTIADLTLEVNETRMVSINCVPTTFGNLNATYRIVSNSTPDNAILDISLTCTGNQGLLTLDDTDHDFGGVIIGQMREQTFRITNGGNVAVTNVNVAIGGPGTGYTIVASPFPVASIAANGGTVDFTVRFLPQAGTDGGDKTFALSGSWGTARTASALLTVHGDGLVEGYDVTPATLTFNQRFDAVTTQPLCITNTGDATVNITSIGLTLASGTQTNEIQVINVVRRACGSTGGSNVTFPVQLLKNQEVEAVVQFDPADRVGMMGATVNVMSDLQTGNPMRQSTVVATSTTAMLTLNPGIEVDFGPTDLDAGPVTRNVTITNTGVAQLDLTSFSRTTNGLFAATLPAGPQNLAMGAAVTIPITYTPTTERPVGQEDTFTITHNIAGVLGAPASQTITIKGRGVDRHIEVGAPPEFPPTFRNPGSMAPVRSITITNTGDATLEISAVMVENDHVWQVDTAPVSIPGQGSHDFMVTFTPQMLGSAPQGKVVFLNNDNTSAETAMATVLLDGMGLDRNVALLGEPVDVGMTAIGLPVTLPDGIVVASMDATNMFTIREIQITDDDTEAFSIPDAPTNATIAASAMQAYDVTFTPTTEGEFTAKALLFLDEDPTHAAEVTLKGRAVFVEVGGGGGCSTTSGGGAGMTLVLGALLLARRRRKLALASATAVALLVPVTAHAQAVEQTFDLDLSLFDPTPSTTGTTLQVQSAAVGNNGDWVLGAVMSNATNPLVIRYADQEHMSITRRTMIEIGGAYAFLDRFEAGLRMPLYNQTGDGLDVGVASPSGTAAGDLVAHVRAQLFETSGATQLVGGLGLAVTFPTASESQYAGVEKPSGRVLGLLTLTPAAIDQRLTITANAGAVVRAKSELQNIRQGSGLVFGGAASVRAARGLWLFGEIYGEVLPASEVPSVMAQAGAMTTAEWLGGVTYRPVPSVNLSLGAGRGLVSGIGTPDLRAVLSLSFTPRARELAPIERTRPPTVDKDSDGDGLADAVDACKDELEDLDGFQDTDGCPDVDNDADGFMDSMDKCKEEAEDKDGFQDDDGCPDFDNDGDGILDAADKCPLVAEDKDGAQDDDGCPEKDNDGDGLEDAVDKCPEQAETINGNADDDGCPDAGDSAIALTPSAVELLETIEFKAGELKPGASRVLGQIAATLRAHPEIVRIRINVHVNPEGKEAKEKALTEERAMAIREWLIKAGVSADRVSGAGLGGTKPLLKGKKSPVNERVEIIILERK